MLGSRDSEIGVLVHNDPNKITTSFNGTSVQVSKLIQDFRLKLWKEHLNIFFKNLPQYAVCYGEPFLTN